MTAGDLPPHVRVGPIRNAEDLFHVRGTRWILAGGMTGPGTLGSLSAIDLDTDEVHDVTPDLGPGQPVLLGDCADPPDRVAFSAHGITLDLAVPGVPRLSVVHHGSRESIEIFDVVLRDPLPPMVTWVGGVERIGNALGNAVAWHGGVLYATREGDRTDPDYGLKADRKELTGWVDRWTAATGWEPVPNSEGSGNNGLAVDDDHCYATLWGGQQLLRVQLGAPHDRLVVDVPFHPDNFHWLDTHTLVVAGHDGRPSAIIADMGVSEVCTNASHVCLVDTRTFEVREVLAIDTDEYGLVSTAMMVGDDLWLGGPRSDGVIRIPAFDAGRDAG